ncbi:13848_t:CDS:2 [Acaulospora morrowiae]|uniref:13848_t:CDS:1 n=1 Tax=Acaulospora morrowiae TaxID=94023 RepID=A0A9N9CUZ6_9GLOM|nr:13848_t:CDS:2 [Acaulospora morrowiae]
MLDAIQHPVVAKSLKYAGTTVGRDKAYRGVQYFARFLTWYLSRKGYEKETVQRFNNLKSTLGSSRKLMRLGKFIEHLQNASKAFNDTDGFSKATTVGRQLSYSVYLFLDTFSWIHASGVYKFNQIKKINENAYRFWLFGIVFSLIHGVYKLNQNRHRRNYYERINKSKIAESGEHSNIRAETAKLRTEHKNLVRQFITDILDILIPATALGHIKVEDGLVGLAGVISSVLGAQSQWNKVSNLK